MRRPPSSALLLVLAACHHGPVAPAQDCTITRIADQHDIARLAGCTRVASLTVRTGITLDWTPLAQLAEISGDLVIGPSLGLDEVQLAGLRTVGGKLAIVSNNLMQAVFLRALEHAGSIEVAANTALATLTMPRLAAVEHDVAIDGPALEVFEAPELVTVGGQLVIDRVPELTILMIPKLDPSTRTTIHTPKVAN